MLQLPGLGRAVKEYSRRYGGIGESLEGTEPKRMEARPSIVEGAIRDQLLTLKNMIFGFLIREHRLTDR